MIATVCATCGAECGHGEELALLRARLEALRALADDARENPRPGEGPLLVGIETCLTAVLGADGLLESPQ